MSMNDERSKVLESAIAQIEKQYGKGSIMRLGSRDVLVPVSVIPTGSIGLDAALGVGGFPRGRVIEIFGPESGGKTTMALHVIAQAQKMGGQAAFIDAERRVNRDRTGGDNVHGDQDVLVPQAHDRALAVLLFDLRDCQIQVF
jgi:recombination protein RecA